MLLKKINIIYTRERKEAKRDIPSLHSFVLLPDRVETALPGCRVFYHAEFIVMTSATGRLESSLKFRGGQL